MSDVTKFINAIAKPQLPGMYNLWSQTCDTEVDTKKGYLARKQRLKYHLECPDPRILIIGEAPGLSRLPL